MYLFNSKINVQGLIMAISDISKAVSVKDQDVFLVEVVDGKPVVKQITEDFVIISSGDIPSNREEFMHFNEKYLAPNGVGIDINSLSDDKIEKYINVLKESLSKDMASEITTDYSGPAFNSLN
nr:hypothetical protein [Raoultella ornithinolytica]